MNRNQTSTKHRGMFGRLLFGPGSGSSGGALPNIFSREAIFQYKAEELEPFWTLAPPEEPLRRRHAKHSLSIVFYSPPQPETVTFLGTNHIVSSNILHQAWIHTWRSGVS